MDVNKQLLDAANIRAMAAGLRDGMGGHADTCAELMEQLAKSIAAAEQAQQAEPVAPGLYAILYRDNWDGEGDVYHLLAEYKDGKWLNDASGKELLQYEGDAILRAWPLSDDKAQLLAVGEGCVPVPAEWIEGLLLGDRQHHIELRAMLATAPQAADSIPAEMTPSMMRAVQMRSELGAYAAANLTGAYDPFAEFWRVGMEEARKGGDAC